MLKKVFSAIVLMAVVFITSQGIQPAAAEAADVWVYGNSRQGYNVYVMSETVKVTANNTISELGYNHDKRKQSVDRIAACVILDTYIRKKERENANK